MKKIVLLVVLLCLLISAMSSLNVTARPGDSPLPTPTNTPRPTPGESPTPVLIYAPVVLGNHINPTETPTTTPTVTPTGWRPTP